jgi:hypothetical protein
MPRPQFTLRALLVATLVVGAFLGGVHFERERRRQDEAAAVDLEAMQIEEGFRYFSGNVFRWLPSTDE